MASVTTPPAATRWRLRGRFPEGELGAAPYPSLIRHLLWHRGVRTLAQASAIMDSIPVDYDPLLLPDAEAAITRLQAAIRDGETIAVYGDFDVDGVTASAILVEGIQGLGGKAISYLPDRFSEGYGVNSAAIDGLRQRGATLLITADCGTSNVDEVAHARALGIDTIIVDHHTIPTQLPDSVALVNPKRLENRYPDNELASGALAFKLMAALYDRLGGRFDQNRYLDLVALSTICDVAPLQDENRWLVKQGLAVLSRTRRPGLAALMDVARVDRQAVTADTIGFAIGPRLNAAGRLAHARLAFDLLVETDWGRARERALELNGLNQERQQATAAAMDLARELLADEDPAAPLTFIGHRDIPSGIVGLVAARLAEDRYRPAVVYEMGDSTSRASCRSIREFDITAALRTCPELLLRFGGHRAAAGFTAENANLPALKEALVRHAANALANVDLVPIIDIDAAIPLDRINGKLIELIFRLAPFGQANPEPTFLSRNLEVVEVWPARDDRSHIRLKLRDDRHTWSAIAFGLGDRGVEAGQRLDVVYTFSPDKGNGGLELRVKDLAPAT